MRISVVSHPRPPGPDPGAPAARFASLRRHVRDTWSTYASLLAAAAIFAWALSLYPPPAILSDAHGYVMAAQRLLRDHVFAYAPNAIGTPVAPNARITPGYPLFLALIFWVVGLAGSPDEAARAAYPLIVAAQYALAVGTVGTIAASGRRLGGNAMGLAAGLLGACYLPFAWAASVALSETLGACLISALLLGSIVLTDPRTKARRRSYLAYGLLWGVTAMTRPVIVLWPVVPVLFAAVRHRGDRRRLAALLAAALAGLLPVLGPWWIRNAVELHAFIPLRSGGGRVMLDGTAGGAMLSPGETAVFASAQERGQDGYAAVAASRDQLEWEAGPGRFIARRLQTAADVVRWPFVAPAGVYNMDASGIVREDHRVDLGPRLTHAPPSLERAVASTVTYQWWLVVLAASGYLLIPRMPRLLIAGSLPVYVLLAHSMILLLDRYFFPAMPAVILLAGAVLISVANELLGVVRRLRHRQAWDDRRGR